MSALSLHVLLLRSEGAFFRAKLVFPEDFPSMPPKMEFLSEMWHPNGSVA